MISQSSETVLERIEGAGGIRLAVDRLGPAEGAPAVLLHGGGQTRHAWGATARRMAAEGYHVLSMDLRRRGDRLHWHWDPSFIAGIGTDRAAENRRLADAARGVTAPTLLVRGEESDVVPVEDLDAFHGLMPTAEVVDVRGAGHMVAGDQNTIFGDAVMNYLHRQAPVGSEVSI